MSISSVGTAACPPTILPSKSSLMLRRRYSSDSQPRSFIILVTLLLQPESPVVNLAALRWTCSSHIISFRKWGSQRHRHTQVLNGQGRYMPALIIPWGSAWDCAIGSPPWSSLWQWCWLYMGTRTSCWICWHPDISLCPLPEGGLLRVGTWRCCWWVEMSDRLSWSRICWHWTACPTWGPTVPVLGGLAEVDVGQLLCRWLGIRDSRLRISGLGTVHFLVSHWYVARTARVPARCPGVLRMWQGLRWICRPPQQRSGICPSEMTGSRSGYDHQFHNVGSYITVYHGALYQTPLRNQVLQCRFGVYCHSWS